MILAADFDRALQTMRRAASSCSRAAPRASSWLGNTKLSAASALRISRIAGSSSYSTRARRGAARRVVARRRDREQRLAGVLHEVVGEDRIVVHDAAVVVLARNIGRGDDGHDAGRRAHCRQIQRLDPAVRDAAHAERSMQRVRRQGDIVGI